MRLLLPLALPLAFALACGATNDSTLDDGGTGAGASSGTATGGSTGTFGVGGQGASSGFNGEECGSSTFGNEVPGTLLVVLDKSGSMSEGPNGEEDANPDKYDLTADAIDEMVLAATPSTEMGLLAFPEGAYDSTTYANCLVQAQFGNPVTPQCQAELNDAGCTDVATTPHVIPQAVNLSGAMINSYLNQNGPAGNTPTLWALRNAYAFLGTADAVGQKYVLLLTDGEPTVHTPPTLTLPELHADCGTEADIQNEVEGASTAGVATFVIGSPGSEGAATFLSRLALLGNTAKDPSCSPAAGDCHYQVGSQSFQQDLQAVLQQIAGVIGDCIFELPAGEDIDPNKVNVTIESSGGTIEVYRDPNRVDGWEYTDASKSTIQLYGPACAQYKAEAGSSMTIILGCETVLK